MTTPQWNTINGVDQLVTVPKRVGRVLLAGLCLLVLRGAIGLAGWFYLVRSTERLKNELKLAHGSLGEAAFPVLGGSPQACNAADRYAQLLIDIARTQRSRAQGETDQWADASVPWFLARLQDSAQCSVCDWHRELNIGNPEGEALLDEGVHLASSRSLTLERLESAVAGREAAALVEILRFSECVTTGPRGMRAHGERLADQAIGALTRLLTERRLATAESLTQLALQLDALKSRHASVVQGARAEGLELAVGLVQAHRERGGRGALGSWLPRHAIAAYQFRRDEALIREVIDSTETCDVEDLRRLTESTGVRVRNSGSGWLKAGLPPTYTWRVVHEYRVARYRLLRAGIDLELTRLRTGSYPDNFAPGALWTDRCSGFEAFVYKRKDSGYELRSEGLRGLKAAGHSKGATVALEVPPAAQRAP